MNIALKRRIAGLERTWPRPKSLADFLQDARDIVRLTGTTLEVAVKGLLVDLSYEDVKRIAAEIADQRRTKIDACGPRATYRK